MLFKSFSDLVSWAENYAKEIHTMVEHHFYEDYNWGSVIFETDKFGGCYAQIKFFPQKNQFVFDGFSYEKKIKSLNELKVLILNEKEKLESKRNLEEIYEEINREY